jgi:replicative DNA helicase
MTDNTAAGRHLAPVDDRDDGPAKPWVIAEQAVLGTAVRSSADAAEALGMLRPDQFSCTAHRVVFEAVEHLSGTGNPVEPSTVLGELARMGMLAKVGTPGMGSAGNFLHSLMQRGGSVAYHAPAVAAAAARRTVQQALASCEAVAANPAFDPAEHLEQIRKIIDDATAVSVPSVLRPNSETVLEVLEALETEAAPGLATGYPDLDDTIGALRPGEVVVVAGRPGGGKSLLGFCIADHVGTYLSLPVLFSSLEMTETELTARRISATAKVPLRDIVRRQVGGGEWDMITRALDRLTDTRLYVDDTAGASLAHIRGRLRAMARTGNAARLLVIDYLGYVAAPKAESRQQAVAELARGTKLIAREFSIPVILLAQLNRGSEHRADKVPTMADLRESGEIEQSADIVILLHRPDGGDPESPRAGEIDLIVDKNRQGARCTVTLLLQGHYGRIVSPAHEWSPSAAVRGAS